MRLLFGLLLLGCGPEDKLAGVVHIHDGIYGQAKVYTDLIGVGPAPGTQLPIHIFSEDPRGQTPDASVNTDENGVYQLERAAGRFFLCGDNPECAGGTLKAGRVRIDVEYGSSVLFSCFDRENCPLDNPPR